MEKDVHDKDIHFDSKCIHGGQEQCAVTGAVMPAIYTSSTYGQESPGVHRGFEYSRSHNLTRYSFERALASLEGTGLDESVDASHGGFAFGSGLAAIGTALELSKMRQLVAQLALQPLPDAIPELAVDAAALRRDGQSLPAETGLRLEPPEGLAVAAPSVVLEGLARRGDGLADDDAFRRVDAVQIAHQRQPRPLKGAPRVLEVGARLAVDGVQAQRGAELLLVGIT
mgnify:CR=1 FL=1